MGAFTSLKLIGLVNFRLVKCYNGDSKKGNSVNYYPFLINSILEYLMTKCNSTGAILSKQAKRPRLDTEKFKERALAVHGKRFDYSKSEFTNTKTKIEIICQKHGSFWQTPTHHFEGRGCQKCGYEVTASYRRSDTKEFISKAKRVHLSRYDYSKVKYTLKDNLVVIICKEHGDFKQSANNHLRGNNCPKCAMKNMGYTRTNFINSCEKYGGTGSLYAIKCFDDKEIFYKIGVTSRSVSDRFCSVVEMPYKYSELYLIENTASYIFDIERRLHSLLRDCSYEPLQPFAGQTECFTTIKPIERLLRQLSSTDQLQLIA